MTSPDPANMKSHAQTGGPEAHARRPGDRGPEVVAA
ncbi:MAG: hypothetical protein JWM72_1614 [Actinomycetia bacterium]|jgi:hypothetical protein|nr:hypothetical protein [Actinomycetes bacterium]